MATRQAYPCADQGRQDSANRRRTTDKKQAPTYLKLLLGAGLIGGTGLTQASVVPWVGTADYTQAPGAVAGQADVVGPFHQYDFSSNGVFLLSPNSVAVPYTISVGDTYTGHYQSYVAAHVDQSGTTVASPNLNQTGSGAGYELTVAATFTEQVTGIDTSGNVTFSVTGGNANLFFDQTPDFNFGTDSGFSNGSAILSGTVSNGTTALYAPGVGFDAFSLTVGALGYDHNVFDPATIGGGSGIFTLQINPGSVSGSVSSVMGTAVTPNDTLLQADGYLNLVAVPLPAPLWLLMSAIGALVPFVRGSRKAILAA